MTSPQTSPRIKCPINRFETCEREIERLTAAINHAFVPGEKGCLVRKLLDAVSTLLDCNAYDQDSLDCRLCRDLSTLRHKTATVIDKVTVLDR